MPGRPKRKRHPATDDKTSKRLKLELPADTVTGAVGQHLLPFYYPHVCTLRSFVRAKCLDKRSKLDQRLQRHTSDSALTRLVDNTLVCCPSDPSADDSCSTTSERERTRRTKDFFEFTQRSSGSSNRRISDGTTIASTLGEGSLSMTELVDFVVWRLFNRTYRLVERPPHVLCHGFRRSTEPKSTVEDRAAQGGIDGLTRLTTNSQVERLREEDWSELLLELGFDGDHVVLELLLDCAVFLPIVQTTIAGDKVAKAGNYWQVSGVSIAETPQLRVNKDAVPTMAAGEIAFKTPPKPALAERSASAISFVRSRMFYARATLNGRGKVHIGLRHIHVLNRYPDPRNDAHARHILKHIFPKQFGLHNVFTSTVDRRETAHPFKDYTLREHEIVAWTQRRGTHEAAKIPKRLRGQCMQLVKKLLTLHRNCSYKELLLHYCPVQKLDDPGASIVSIQKRKRRRVSDGLFPTSTAAQVQAKALLSKPGSDSGKHLTELATPLASVSAFVRSVVWTILPRDFLGDGTHGAANFQHLLESIHKFVMCKRFENLTLDSVTRKVKIGSIDWLRPQNVAKASKMSQSDLCKRQELLGELLYYVFDSLVIPLIRSNFHVTESNDHKYRLFYFRHDVWRLITQPALSRIKLDMFREIPTSKAQKLLGQRTLGYSRVRLLPKRATVRPITNLRRRTMVKRRGKTYLAASINSTMRNVFGMLNYEKSHQPGLLQSSIFSVNELYPQLLRFQEKLNTKGLAGQPLYFVKVDVQSCFDTIPQRRVVDLVERICHGTQYTIKHHAEVKSALPEATGVTRGTNKPTRKFLAPAHASKSSETGTFAELLEQQYTRGKKNTVFVEGAVQTNVDTEAMLDLLDEHVMRNIVRIGKKYYRQKNGIPQGSILSTLLCSFFYGDFEARKLSFLRKPAVEGQPCETTLIRLIDDFLLITTERNHAERFLSTMLAGDSDYGITVKPEKSLASFKPSSDKLVAETKIGEPFPWCNVLINTKTLAVTRDRSKTVPYLPSLVQSKSSLLKLRGRAPDLADSMNLETHRRAGAAFHRKVMAMLRINMRAMYIDMCSTPMPKMMRELFVGLLEVAEKASRYLVSLQKLNSGEGLRSKVIQQTIQDVAHSTSSLLKKGRRFAHTRIGKADVEFLVAQAFLSVFRRQRSRYTETLAWLGDWNEKLEVDRSAMVMLLKLGSA